MEKALNL